MVDKMKIVLVDNYDRDDRSDFLVAENVTEHFANLIVKLLNEKEGKDSPNFYRAVPDNYKLKIWEP